MSGDPGAAARPLGRVERLAAELHAVAWFASVGMAPRNEERAAARAYLAALGRRDAPVAWVAGWDEAARAAGHGWPESETRLADALLAGAAERAAEAEILRALDRLASAAADVVIAASARRAAEARVGDTMLIRAAADAARESARLAGLAHAAGAPEDHPFLIRYRLFASGRWPLGFVDDRLHVF